jgi:hypothetical protein
MRLVSGWRLGRAEDSDGLKTQTGWRLGRAEDSDGLKTRDSDGLPLRVITEYPMGYPAPSHWQSRLERTDSASASEPADSD